ncbi:MAG: transcriptional repressor [Cytophagales bacterium]|nr:transcriptional repressor [Cytophagales bacterium]
MLEDKLENRAIKPTTMRLLVLKELVESSTAINLKLLEAKFERADRTTLFRTLKTFEEKKLIHSVDDGTGSVKYSLCTDSCACKPQDQHVHFYCEKCEETFCLTQSQIPESQVPVGFNVSSASMVYKGVCANCS